MTHICVSKLTIIGSDNGLSPGRRLAIILTNAGISSTGPLGTNFSGILIENNTFSLKKMHLKMSSGKWRLSCLGFNVLNTVNRNVADTLSNFQYRGEILSINTPIVNVHGALPQNSKAHNVRDKISKLLRQGRKIAHAMMIYMYLAKVLVTLQWRNNERNGVSKHRRLDCLLHGLFRRRSKKTSKLRVTGLCKGNR